MAWDVHSGVYARVAPLLHQLIAAPRVAQEEWHRMPNLVEELVEQRYRPATYGGGGTG